MNASVADLNEISRRVKWSSIEKRLICLADEGEASGSSPAPQYSPIVLFRAILLQRWYGLIDPLLLQRLERDLAFRRFVGLHALSGVPTVECLARFRREYDKSGAIAHQIARLQLGLNRAGIVVPPGRPIDESSGVNRANERQGPVEEGPDWSRTEARKLPGVSKGAPRYDLVSRLLHWLFALSIVYISISGYCLTWIDSWNHEAHEFVANFNVSLATLLTPLFPLRVIWAHVRKEVPPVPGTSSWQHRLARLAHSLIYMAIGAVLFSGYLMIPSEYQVFNLFTVSTPFHEGPATHFFFVAHRVSCAVLAGLVILHVLAVVQHYVAHHVNIVRRMI